MSTLFGFTDPFSDLLEMQRQMDTLMNTFTTTFDMPLLTGVDVGDVSGGRGRLTTTPAPTRTKATKKRMWRPQLDVCETQNSLVLHAELPGCNKEDIKLSVTDDNRLVLEGRKRTHKKEKGENWLRRERFWGTFYRTLPLPSGVDVQQIQANYENGVLDVVIPKPQAATSGQKQIIDIKTAEPGATSQITQPQEKGEQRELQPQQVEQPKAEQGKPEETLAEQPKQEKPEETQKPLEERERETQQPREEKPEETQQPQEEREQQEVLPQQVEQPKAEQEKPEETQKPLEEKEREETQQLREEKPEETQQPQEEREQQEVRPQQPKAEQEKPEETQKPLKEEREQQPQLVEQPMPEETQMPLEKEQPTARTEEQAPTEQKKAEEQKGKLEEKIQEQKDESSIFIGAQSQGQQL